MDVLSDEALVAARSRLNPAAGAMLSALWVTSTSQLVLIIHHLAVDGVSWRILLEDLNIAWAQHHSGQPMAAAGGRDVVCPVVIAARRARAPPEVVGPGGDLAAGGGGPGRTARTLQPEVDTYASAGQLSAELDVGDDPAAAR